ncbi:outer envelope protein [Acinetobacter rathckeae]|uniref:outer envelope protein n=1 Tax=Acinetobacter rathckeae TaxID=2605272 RepID=UPI0018A2D0C3|nr:outer envelope protein [Acinetobacter rathckeae]MBF7688237.1 outer envelope protein [Acinetobacter rathckeae]MBF7695245.1 outer envelope protein [Acinetobacter rathckeae]
MLFKHFSNYRKSAVATALLSSVLLSTSASALTWSDNSIGWRYGTDFAEPFKNNSNGSKIDITKQIYSFTHASGYAYGTNFLNVDFLQSSSEPNTAQTGGKGTQEAYLVYRNNVDIGKVFKTDLSSQGIRGYALTAGLDWNTKNDGYASKKQMWVVGPTINFDVPGFLSLSTLVLFESNKPAAISSRYSYDPHAAFQLSWGMPIGKTPLAFEGFALWIDSKGKNEFGGKTAPETNIDARVMYDLTSLWGKNDQTFRAGFEYQYWHNKFGNPTTGNKGATASTPMVRVDYHF